MGERLLISLILKQFSCQDSESKEKYLFWITPSKILSIISHRGKCCRGRVSANVAFLSFI